MSPASSFFPRRGAAPLLAAVVLLAGCSAPDKETIGEEAPDYEPKPIEVNEPVPAAEAGQLRLPYQLQNAELLDPGWDTAPKFADGAYLAPAETGGVLTFTAADAEGETLWQAERPMACSGFTLTSDGDQALAILTDLKTQEGGFGPSTATAYDLHTGEEVWGPVEVPGPHQGPGTVFAAPPEEQMGEVGPKTVLDPATGEVIADETTDDLHVIGEYHGTVLIADDTALHAYQGNADTPEWSLSLGEDGWDAETLFSQGATSIAPLSAALIGIEADDLSLIDLETGDPIAEGLRDAAQEPTTGTWITLGEDFAAYDETGQQLFSRDEGEDMQLESAGAVIAYLRTEAGQVQAHNAITGDIAQAYDPAGEGPPIVPLQISATGTAVVQSEQGVLLAPSEPPEQ